MLENKNNKLYKYTPIECAIKVLQNQSVKLEFPNNYNDPFDSVIEIRKKDEEKALEIIAEYYTAQVLLAFLNDKSFKVRKRDRIVMNFAKISLKLFLHTNRKNEYYDSIPVVHLLTKMIINNNEKEFQENIKLNANNVFKTIEELRNKALISCFSKKNDSLLMWSHYAYNHKGVCIEFDRPKEDFFDVNYSNKRCVFNLEYLTRKYLGLLLKEEKIDIYNEELIKKIMRPFIIKSKDWKYEEEVRCIFTKDSKNVYFDGKYYLFKMPSIPTKIFIGCKVDKQSEDYKTLIKEASDRKIEIIEMEVSDTEFAVIPKKTVQGDLL